MKILVCLIVFFLSQEIAFSQTVTISGQISDVESGEYLPGATVYCQQILGGTVSNGYGFFSMKVNQGANALEISYVGYKKQQITIDSNTDTVLTVALQPNIELSEVTINAQGNLQRLQSTTVSSHSITAKSLQKLPSLLGESDIIKQIRSLPGVSAAAEGAAGLVIRGSGPDETLVLYDGVPVYNINHLYGFYSVFNTDALASATMYKGAYPARYGGRISSVLDVRMREGNLKKYSGNISIGTLASKFTLEGPLIKDKASFILSTRRTYIDIFMGYLMNVFNEQDLTRYLFDDYNLKLNYKINAKNRLFISGYTGKDKYKENLKNSSGTSASVNYMDWGNSLASLRWNRVLGAKAFVNTTAYFCKYNYKAGRDYLRDEGDLSPADTYETSFNEIWLHDYALKSDFDYSLSNKHGIKAGLHYTFHDFSPNSYSYYGIKVYSSQDEYNVDTLQTNSSLELIKSNEWHAFVEDEIKFSDKLKMNAGLHYSGYKHCSKIYNYVLPRFSVVYLPQKRLSFKLASGLYSQYSFLVSNPAMGLPTDIWLQSTHGLKPMLGWQSVLGTMYNTYNDWLFSFETYYKDTRNVAGFKEMVQYNVFEIWDEVLEQGRAIAYGFEFMVEKQAEKYMLKASYAHNRAFRKFDNLNQGNSYLYTYDAPHTINIEGNYKFNKRVDMGITWVFASGKLMTLVENNYQNYFFYESLTTIWNYADGYNDVDLTSQMETVTERNNHRVEPYHRLDVGVNLRKDKPRGQRTWSFGVYNAYNRKNVYFISSMNQEGYEKISLAAIVPYFAYSFKF